VLVCMYPDNLAVRSRVSARSTAIQQYFSHKKIRQILAQINRSNKKQNFYIQPMTFRFLFFYTHLAQAEVDLIPRIELVPCVCLETTWVGIQPRFLGWDEPISYLVKGLD
jgi:hypothetical protein